MEEGHINPHKDLFNKDLLKFRKEPYHKNEIILIKEILPPFTYLDPELVRINSLHLSEDEDFVNRPSN